MITSKQLLIHSDFFLSFISSSQLLLINIYTYIIIQQINILLIILVSCDLYIGFCCLFVFLYVRLDYLGFSSPKRVREKRSKNSKKQTKLYTKIQKKFAKVFNSLLVLLTKMVFYFAQDILCKVTPKNVGCNCIFKFPIFNFQFHPTSDTIYCGM